MKFISSLFLLFSFFFIGCSKQWAYLPESKADERSIYVMNNGWHTGIVVSAKDLNRSFDFVKDELGDAMFYEFGWGDKQYYPAKDAGLWLTIRAVLWPTDSVMHVVAIPTHPKRYFPQSQSIEVNLSKKGLGYLVDHLYSSFRKNDKDKVIPLQSGLYGRSYFYDAEGSFYLFHMCNTWTAESLQKAGLPVSSFMTLRAGNVIKQAKEAAKSYKPSF